HHLPNIGTDFPTCSAGAGWQSLTARAPKAHQGSCSTMDSAPVSEAGDVGSIPAGSTIFRGRGKRRDQKGTQMPIYGPIPARRSLAPRQPPIAPPRPRNGGWRAFWPVTLAGRTALHAGTAG